MLCPDCKNTLETIDYGEVSLDTCPRCAGVWFDADELVRLQQSSPGALTFVDAQITPRGEAPKATAAKLCPKCSEELYSYRYLYTTAILLDACPACGGIWVQDGELAAVDNAATQAKIPNAKEELALRGAMAVSNMEEEHRKNMVKIERFKEAAKAASMQMRPGLLDHVIHTRDWFDPLDRT